MTTAEPETDKPDKNGLAPGRLASRSLLFRRALGRLGGEKPEKLPYQSLEWDLGQRLARVHHDVPPAGNSRPVQAKRLPQPALHPIAQRGASHTRWHSNPEAGVRKAIGSEKYSA